MAPTQVNQVWITAPTKRCHSAPANQWLGPTWLWGELSGVGADSIPTTPHPPLSHTVRRARRMVHTRARRNDHGNVQLTRDAE
jgi:hypothetical protein